MSAKYQRIAQALELSVRSGSMDEKLPTEAQLCAQFGCSRQTVRSALALLESRGLIVRRQGSGSYLSQAAGAGRQIAFILADREEYTAPASLRQAQSFAQEAGYTLLCLETRGSREREAECLSRLLHNPPAGILLEPITDMLGCFHGELLERIRGQCIPLIYLNGRYDTLSPAVTTQDGAAAEELAAHLAASGHQKIAAMLKWDDSRGLERFRGLSSGARKLGLTFDAANCMWYSQAERNQLLEGDDRLLKRFSQEFRGDCTAAVCFNDELAFRLQRFLQTRQQELRLVSFDNSYLARDGSLTSMSPAMSPIVAGIRALITSAPPPPIPWTLIRRRSG